LLENRINFTLAPEHQAAVSKTSKVQLNKKQGVEYSLAAAEPLDAGGIDNRASSLKLVKTFYLTVNTMPE